MGEKKKAKQGGGKKEKKKDKASKEDAAPAPAPVKKAEHPYKIMDKEQKSPFINDAWKKMYSNCTTYDEAMKYESGHLVLCGFWELKILFWRSKECGFLGEIL